VSSAADRWRPGGNVPHVFVAPADCHADHVTVRGDTAHHLLTVLRRDVGDAVSVADDSGTVRHVVIRRISAGEAVCEVIAAREVPVTRPRVRVVCGLPKQRKLDEVIGRLTELGVDEVVPAHTARSQVRLDARRAARARTRWQAVARAASGQSRRARLLHVASVTSWDRAFTGAEHGVVFWEEAVRPFHDVAFDDLAADITVGVGPEGGLTAQEITMTGLPAVALGDTILRTETASVVAPALVLHRLGRLG
jgi:16S rRNA (uracil1498-N3)-methyltransferase